MSIFQEIAKVLNCHETQITFVAVGNLTTCNHNFGIVEDPRKPLMFKLDAIRTSESNTKFLYAQCAVCKQFFVRTLNDG